MLPELNEQRQRLLRWAERGLAAVDARRCTANAVRKPGDGAIAVLAIGKAAAGMAEGAASVLNDDVANGLVIAPAKTSASLPARFAWQAGDHPVPGESSLAAGRVLKEWLHKLAPDLPLLVLLSGGGSALVEWPLEGLGANEVARLNRWLLASGLDIHAMNAIRSRFSNLKRGGLLHAAGDRAVTGLVVSDVPGDRIESVASGPLSPQPFAWPDVPLPAWLHEWHETLPLPVTNPDRCAKVRVIARNADALAAIEAAAREEGISVAWRGELQGQVEECARRIAARMLSGPPGFYLAGGETSLRLPASPGRGGRNQHLALALALELDTAMPACVLALASDGIDGNSDDAGGLVDHGSAGRVRAAGLDPGDCLARADSGRALEAAGDLVHTGPTGTNVADVLIGFKP